MPRASPQLSHFFQQLTPKVTLIAVSKYSDAAQIREAYELGLRHFGESRIQEAEKKKEALSDLADIQWHLIGHLQSNKIKKAVQLFDWIHSVDSLELLQKINITAEQLNKKPNLLLQIKLAPDPSKGGFEISGLWNNLSTIFEPSTCPIVGLMTILPAALEEETQYTLFAQLKQLLQEINQNPHICLTELSMGMSSDCTQALKAGATMLRIGKAIFLP